VTWLRTQELLAAQHIADGLVRVPHDGVYTMWTRGLGRKSCKCWSCREFIPARVLCWRPLTNGLFRAERLCVECVGLSEPKEATT
jgi:hypothetical protein